MRRLAAVAVVLSALVLVGCSAYAGGSTWPESVEFSTLASGQDRFSVHDTNVVRLQVIVDHQTGVEYILRENYGMCPLLNADGTPLRVSEAG